MMEISLFTLLLLPAGLGLIGFVEPCTIGAHLLFLSTQETRAHRERVKAALIFVAARALVAGLAGALITFLGARIISAQTGLWLVFGLIYLTIGLFFLAGRGGAARRRITLAPAAWRHADNPLILGLAFGLNIPACSAPILFGLLALTATTGTVLAGFTMMAVFGLALSLPLVLFALRPGLAERLQRLGQYLRKKPSILGLVFVLLGVWSIWFGLYVDPVDWSGQ